MAQLTFPDLAGDRIAETRDAVHSYTQVLGDWRASCTPRRKHWWHISLYPSVRGLTTGLIHANIDFELELDLQSDRLLARVADGNAMSEPLGGRPAQELMHAVTAFLADQGIDASLVPDDKQRVSHTVAATDYSTSVARNLALTVRSVSAAMTTFRAGISEETSPIQLWPHHFDLAMLYLPGGKIPGQDPSNEEMSDKQMNFGFLFGDNFLPEPYFYITAYPFPAKLTDLKLSNGAEWQTEGFTGVVLPYRRLLDEPEPGTYLVNLWNSLLSAGRVLLLD